MSTLAATLAWAARGFRVFPLGENSKLPIDVGWTTSATTNPEIIKSWWTDPVTGVERNYNIGCLTTEWIVIDVDTKQGKPGLRTMAELGLEFDTLVVATPGRGYHLYYRRRDKPTGQSPLGEGVDVRSHNGYVLAPGSIIEGVEYRVVCDSDPIPFPGWLVGRLSASRTRGERRDTDLPFDLDQPEFIEIATHWLRTAAPKAIEGQNGDDTTYCVACRIRDFGCSADVCVDLLADLWNPACSPPWELEALRRKVENAYQYATGSPGSATAQAAFAAVTVLEPPNARFYHGPNGSPYHFGNLLAIGEIETRPWIFGNILLNRTVTAVFAGPGGGKSMLKLIIAAHLAVGKDFLGYTCHKGGRSIVFDAEDDVKEMSRRLHAICFVFGLDLEKVRAGVCLVSQDEILLRLTTGGNFPQINLDHVAALIEQLHNSEVVLLAIGPLAELHSSSENDNIVMRYVMGVLRMLAQQGDVAVLVDHHTAKPPIASSQAWVGDQFAGRGASAVPAAARRVVTMYAASEADCTALGVRLDQRDEFVRIDDGKVSYGRKGGPKWLRWTNVRIWNGDDVGVLAPHDAKDSAAAAARLLAVDLIDEMRKQATSLLPIDQVVSVLMRNPLTAKEGRSVARNRLERMLAEAVSVDGVEVALLRGAKGLEGVTLR